MERIIRNRISMDMACPVDIKATVSLNEFLRQSPVSKKPTTSELLDFVKTLSMLDESVSMDVAQFNLIASMLLMKHEDDQGNRDRLLAQWRNSQGKKEERF